ncbi:class I lanthipeptide [Chitinophaga qingshengii]|uniref:Class I lanthipeptide n=1 Tax=Chitinophaga qingshengii TaxID=1569794 RepID=A0ABR7TQW0_9BACT|nr:class I lanthipeptide [Chitinophaga qingshengii]MBC9932852.1 class I lanthipeptide [Chitinophaga qingshengii]
MKKKTIVGKKMSFNKITVAHLNAQQQSLIAGGMPPFTFRPECLVTREETCQTIPYTQEACVFC